MANAWFVLYHAYSTSFNDDEKALKRFEKDVEHAGELDIKYVIMEDYYARLTWGEYLTPWNESNLRQMIKIIHDHGLKFLPYVDATELATKGKIYQKNGKVWGAKNRWGKIYTGFNSIFLPLAYPYSEYDFITKLMCPASGWRSYLCNQVETLQEKYEADGIYVDRIDYRVQCHDHSHEHDHFNNGILELIKDIKDRVKSFGPSQTCMMNDSCMNPDDTMAKCMKTFDFVLNELLPIDWDPLSLPIKLQLEWGDLAWYFRGLLKPMLRILTEAQFNQSSMMDATRILKIVERIEQYKSPNEIFLFTHKKDQEGLRAISRIARHKGTNLVYFSGFKPLNSIKKA
ncbi:MAG: DUF6259 domain-containing protein [Candidatus Helarchaeota archaeon]